MATVQQLTNAGLANLTAAWAASGSLPKYLQWGTGSAAAKSANVVTTTTTTEARTSGTVSVVTTSITGDTYQIVGTIAAAGARTITEVGVFDAAGSNSPPTGGNMDIYGDFGGSSIALNAGDSITVTIKVQFS